MATIVPLLQIKVTSQGPSPPPSAILLTGMTTVPWRTIILDRQADIKWAGSCPCQDWGRKASQKVQSCRERRDWERSLLHTLLSTLLCQNRLIQCVHKPWGMFLSKEKERKARDRIKNQTWIQRLSLQGGEALHMFTQTFPSHSKWKSTKKVWWKREGGALKQDKTNRSSETHVVSSLWC